MYQVAERVNTGDLTGWTVRRAEEQDFMVCRFCGEPARFVLTPLGGNGRVARMIKLAEPICGRRLCLGPGGRGPGRRFSPDHPRSRGRQTAIAATRARGYVDVMLDFIHSERNNDPDCYQDGCRWTWHTPAVWARWLAGKRVRDNLRHAENHANSDGDP